MIFVNSNPAEYDGDGTGNVGGKHSEEISHKEWGHSVKVPLPALGVNVYEWKEKV